jgi:predicted transcriptional regulator
VLTVRNESISILIARIYSHEAIIQKMRDGEHTKRPLFRSCAAHDVSTIPTKADTNMI